RFKTGRWRANGSRAPHAHERRSTTIWGTAAMECPRFHVVASRRFWRAASTAVCLRISMSEAHRWSCRKLPQLVKTTDCLLDDKISWRVKLKEKKLTRLQRLEVGATAKSLPHRYSAASTKAGTNHSR